MSKNKWIVPYPVARRRPSIVYRHPKQRPSWERTPLLLTGRAFIFLAACLLLISILACSLGYLLAN